MRCLLMLRRRPVAAKGAAQLALCGSLSRVGPAGRGVDQMVTAQVNLVQFL